MASFLTKRQQQERWVALDIACEDFVKSLKGKRDRYAYGYDGALLYDVLISTYRDIQRYKELHQTNPKKQKSDSVKRAAYSIKWLMRLQPIWVARPRRYTPSNDDTPLLLNEKFAIEWAFANLGFEHGRALPILRREVLVNFLYYLHFRAYNEDGLIEIIQLLYDAAVGKSPYVNLAIDLE